MCRSNNQNENSGCGPSNCNPENCRSENQSGCGESECQLPYAHSADDHKAKAEAENKKKTK